MAVRMDSNIDQVLTGLTRDMGFRRKYTVTLVNTAEYASYVDQHEGIDIFDPVHMKEEIYRQLRAMEAAGLEPNKRNIENALHAAGFKEVNYLKSYTGEKADPVKIYTAGKDPILRTNRFKHPAGFADRTTLLMRSYNFRVGAGPLVIQVEADEV